MTFRKNIKSSFKFIFRNYIWILLIGMYFSIPKYFQEYATLPMKDVKWVLEAINYLLDFLFFGIVTSVSLAYFSGEKASWSEGIAKTFSKLPSLVGLYILSCLGGVVGMCVLGALLSPIFIIFWAVESYALLMTLAWCLLIISLVIIFSTLFCSLPALMFEKLNPLEAIKLSYRLSEKCLFEFLGYLVFISIFVGVPTLIVDKIFADSFAAIGIKTLLRPFAVMLQVLASLSYLNQRQNKEQPMSELE